MTNKMTKRDYFNMIKAAMADHEERENKEDEE